MPSLAMLGPIAAVLAIGGWGICSALLGAATRRRLLELREMGGSVRACSGSFLEAWRRTETRWAGSTLFGSIVVGGPACSKSGAASGNRKRDNP
ncbi:hypothetical protein ACIBI9_63955 [Nonomuraea sp. NPDC050451]|uniref:hypothetical protein n=1 Tax=Nonomuraea sp. NPDC050451 TaxID=3364364 RepID=UPI00378A8CA3